MYTWLENDFNRLVARFQKNRLHHAMLVTGQQGIGKSDFCHELAGFLLCQKVAQHGQTQVCGQCQSCTLLKAQTHPDFHIIQSDKQIGVDLIRGAIEKLISKAQLSGNKVLIIEAADSMTESAANALLKTLEEPTDDTFLMLLSDKPEKLLPTILSRCEKHRLSTPSSQECIAWLSSQGYNQVSETIVNVYTNRPLKIASELSKDKGLTFEEFKSSLLSLSRGDKSSLELAEAWQNDAFQVINWLQYQIRELGVKAQSAEALWLCNDELKKANSALSNPGVNRILILTGVLNRYVKVTNSAM